MFKNYSIRHEEDNEHLPSAFLKGFDPRVFGPSNEDNIYTPEEVTIGDQIWAKYNLDYPVNGTYHQFDMLPNGGREYNIDQAMYAIHQIGNGWRIPTMDDWAKLFTFVNADFSKLQAVDVWNHTTTDDFGFAALPMGGYNHPPRQDRAYWWTATPGGPSVFLLFAMIGNGYQTSNRLLDTQGCYVRLIKE